MSKEHIRACGEALKATAKACAEGATDEHKKLAQEAVFQFNDSHTPTLVLQLWQVQQSLIQAVAARSKGFKKRAGRHTADAVRAAHAITESAPDVLPGRNKLELDS